MTTWRSFAATTQRVQAERRLYEQYAAGATDVINLSNDSDGDGCNSDEGQGPDPMTDGLSRQEARGGDGYRVVSSG